MIGELGNFGVRWLTSWVMVGARGEPESGKAEEKCWWG
jgi:hypothetical protein